MSDDSGERPIVKPGVPGELPPEAEGIPGEVAPRSELIAYIRPTEPTGGLAPNTWRYLERQAKISWYRVVAVYKSESFWARLLYATAYLALPVTSAIKLGLSKTTLFGVFVLIVLQGRKALADYSPKHVRLVERSYLERKLLFGRVIDQMRRGDLTDGEVQRLREDALRLVAMYVRGYRHDMRGKKIFANLLVEEGDEIVVMARNESHRLPGARYRRAAMFATRVFETGEPTSIGDLYREMPDCERGKKYSSILLLPVMVDTHIAGVLSVDSQMKYHFDDHVEMLMDYLRPYTAVLAWTLAHRYGRGVNLEGGENP